VPNAAEPTPAAEAPLGGNAEAVVQSAVALLGTPYRFGGSAPDSGFDCSGLVAYVMAQHAVSLPRSVSEQFRLGAPVTWNHLRPGDLVFFTTTGPGPTHVGIVVDANAGAFVHAPSDGSHVRIDRLDSEYWRRHWIGAKRLF
jgi:cell wall-associated NlpC family hydrolase